MTTVALQSMGKSLTFRGAVFEAQDILRHHRCKDPICDTNLWKTRHELDLTRLRVLQLERSLDAHGIKPPARYSRHSTVPVDAPVGCGMERMETR